MKYVSFQTVAVLFRNLFPDHFILLVGVHEVGMRLLFGASEGISVFRPEGEQKKNECSGGTDEGKAKTEENAQKECRNDRNRRKNTKNHLENLSHFENIHV